MSGFFFLQVLALVVAVVWVITLGQLLARRDLDPVTKLMWVVVIIFVPVIGIIFYYMICQEPR